ncbi:hypothetical protein [Solicola sp. PLA-1-18]|uniref:hypothetical protein n=1 Tax=Solicola sp. PLA-1-18 TaxID=3380532 RepID=UPI003B78EA12
MERTRKIAASPVRPAGEAWNVVKTLLADSLEKSSQVPDSSVRAALAPLDGVVPSLIASGYLATNALVLVAGDLNVNIFAVRGDDAFAIEEHLNPLPGAGSAPEAWRLYVPSPLHLREIVGAACSDDAHLISGKPPAATESASATASRSYTIDPAALRRM